MKFMEKAKRFFTLSANHDGFTLVELIVVIAILAILAGVAVPAYSGYVKKAEKTGDLQLLAAVNKAFAAACLNEGTDIALIRSASLEWTGKAVTGVASVAGKDASGYDAAFNLFYSGNEGAEFKVIGEHDLAFVQGVGFMELGNVPAGSSYTIGYGDGYITLDSTKVGNVKDSTYGAIGASNLLDQVDKIAGVASGMGSLSGVWNSNAFLNSAAVAMGTDVSQLEAKQLELAKEALKKQGYTDDQITAMGTSDPVLLAAKADVMANATVLYTAQTISNMEREEINNLLENATAANIKANLENKETTEDGLAQAALMYGLAYAYANTEEGKAAGAKAENADDVVKLMETSGFKDYMNDSTKSDKDLTAYLDALDMISSTTTAGNKATGSILTSGFADDELKEILGGILGN